MTDEQKQKALALVRCTFPVGSGQKRFANSMGGIARNVPDREITPKQAEYLNLLFHQYRRQMPKPHRRLCDCAEAKALRQQLPLKEGEPK